MQTDLALLVFVKFPEAGKVKTRLAQTIGDERAAACYREFIALTLRNAEALAGATRFVVFTPVDKERELRAMFPGAWHWLAQLPVADLGMRIHHALQTVLAMGYRRVVIIGSDSPTLPVAYLEEAAAQLEQHDIVLGPAEDGGYYLIGAKAAPFALFEGIAWSTAEVYAQTKARAQTLKLSVHALPAWYDVDDAAGLERINAALGRSK